MYLRKKTPGKKKENHYFPCNLGKIRVFLGFFPGFFPRMYEWVDVGSLVLGVVLQLFSATHPEWPFGLS